MSGAISLGEEVPGWTPPPRPGPSRIEGRYATLERLDPDRHGPDLFRANASDDGIWAYMPYGPFPGYDSYHAWLATMAGGADPMFYAIRDGETGRWSGVASWLRIAPEAGSIEVGHICCGPPLQRTRAATDAMYLMMRWAFEAGYRRYEWKCNALNIGSRRAAERLGLSYEGIFRQAAVVKGRNRDTAWFAAIDREWPAIEAAFTAWLAPGNFDAQGAQRQSLSALTRPVLVTFDPAGAGG